MPDCIIKLRIGDAAKERIALAAEARGSSLSEFVRFAANRAAEGATSPRRYRTDMDTIRRSMNAIEAMVPIKLLPLPDQARTLEAIAALREIAARGLGLPR